MPFATTRAASTMATTQPCAGARLVGTSTMILGENSPLFTSVGPRGSPHPLPIWEGHREQSVPGEGCPGVGLPWMCWAGVLVGRRDDTEVARALSPCLPSVSPVSENQVASSEGYVLFYQLMQEPPRCL